MRIGSGSSRRLGSKVAAILLGCANLVAQAPVITPNSVANAASFAPGMVSGSWITIFGANLSGTTRAWATADFQNGRLPLSLDGVSVKINNKDAPVYFISPTQINALAPADTAVGPVSVTVTTSRGASAPVQATYQKVLPGFFRFSPSNGIYPAAVHLDGTYVGRAGLFGSAVTTTPARPNERISLFGTGFGVTTPTVDPLVIFNGAAPLSTPNDLRILIDNQPVTVEFAGLAGNGLYQFNIVVPDISDGDHAIVAQIGGVSSPSTMRLTTQRPPPLPQLTKISQDKFVWGESAVVTLTGTNLSGATNVELSDSTNLRITGDLSTGSTFVTFRLNVDGGAAEGERTVAVVSPAGRSNTLTFNIRRGNPTLTEFQPAVVYPDRLYVGVFSFNASSRNQFNVKGTDLAGVQSADISPSTGIRLVRDISLDTAIGGWLFVDANAPLGLRNFTAASPAGTTNALTFQVQPVPPTAPVISDVTLDAPSTSFGAISYSGKLTFTDSDGDIHNRSGVDAAFIRLTPISGNDGSAIVTLDVSGSFLAKEGQTSGTIDLSFRKNAFLAIEFNNATQVAVTLVDAANHPSNTVIVTVRRWVSPVF